MTVVILILIAREGVSQDIVEETHKPQIRGAIMMANSHVPNAMQGEKSIAVIPAWGFDLDYFFHPHWLFRVI